MATATIIRVPRSNAQQYISPRGFKISSARRARSQEHSPDTTKG